MRFTSLLVISALLGDAALATKLRNKASQQPVQGALAQASPLVSAPVAQPEVLAQPLLQQTVQPVVQQELLAQPVQVAPVSQPAILAQPLPTQPVAPIAPVSNAMIQIKSKQAVTTPLAAPAAPVQAAQNLAPTSLPVQGQVKLAAQPAVDPAATAPADPDGPVNVPDEAKGEKKLDRPADYAPEGIPSGFEFDTDVYTDSEVGTVSPDADCQNSCCICPESQIRDHFINIFRRMAKREEKVCEQKKIVEKIKTFIKVDKDGKLIPEPKPEPGVPPTVIPTTPGVTPPPDKPLEPIVVEGCELDSKVTDKILELSADKDTSFADKAYAIADLIQCSCAKQLDEECCCMCCCDGCGCE